MPSRLSPFPELAGRLATQAHFLDAAEDLRTLFLIAPSNLTSQPKKLVALLEVAKRTLELAGIKLHVFSSCPQHLEPLKVAYFNLLLELKAQLPNITISDRELQVRLSRLLFPLSTTMTIGRETDVTLRCMGVSLKGDSNDSEDSSSSSASSSTGDANHETDRNSKAWRRRAGRSVPPPPHSMPPPSPDPSKVSKLILSNGQVSGNLRTFHAQRSRPTSRSRVHDIVPIRKRKHDMDSEREDGEGDPDGEDEVEDDDGEDFAPIVFRQPRRAFGIFCTNKGAGSGQGHMGGSRVPGRY